MVCKFKGYQNTSDESETVTIFKYFFFLIMQVNEASGPRPDNDSHPAVSEGSPTMLSEASDT